MAIYRQVTSKLPQVISQAKTQTYRRKLTDVEYIINYRQDGILDTVTVEVFMFCEQYGI